MFRRPIDHTPNCSHQNRPRLIMKYDNYRCSRQIRRIWFVDASVINCDDTREDLIQFQISKKKKSYNFLRTSGNVRFNGIRSLAIRLNRFIWNFCCIFRTSFAGTMTGLPLSPSPGTGEKSLMLSASKIYIRLSSAFNKYQNVNVNIPLNHSKGS